jgi:LysM repeat protein
MMIVDQLVVQHQTLRNRVAENPDGVEMNEILALMDQVRVASAYIDPPPQREQLQAILYHWNGYVHEKTGQYPATQLMPYAPSPAAGEPIPPEKTISVTTSRTDMVLPHVHWLVWAAAILLLVGGAVIIIWPSVLRPSTTNTAVTPTQSDAVFTAVAATQTTIAQNAVATRSTIQQTSDAAVLLLASAMPTDDSTAVPVPPASPVAYTVQQGDTLISLARRFGTTPNDIMVMNGLTGDSLMVGQTLILPVPLSTPLAVAVTPLSVTVLPGTTVPLMVTPVLEPGEQLVQVVILSQVAPLRSGPGEQFGEISPLPRGTFAYVLGRSQDGIWYLLQLEDGVTRGWTAMADVGLIYPATPQIIPVITTP